MCERQRELVQIHDEAMEGLLVVVVRRGTGRGDELLSGLVKVGGCAAKAKACGAIGTVQDFEHKYLVRHLGFLARTRCRFLCSEIRTMTMRASTYHATGGK